MERTPEENPPGRGHNPEENPPGRGHNPEENPPGRGHNPEENPPVLTAPQEWVKRETARRLRQNMTAAETRLWQHLRAGRLRGLRFYRQQVVGGFIADFYCDAARLVVEADGPVHRAQTEYDTERDRIFARLGLLTLRFPNASIEADTYAVVKTIRRAALARL